MEENRIETMENENVELVEVDNDVVYDESGSDEGLGIIQKIGIVLAVGTAIGIGVKKAGPKFVNWCENKTLARAEKIIAKRELAASKDDEVEVETVDAEVIDVETE